MVIDFQQMPDGKWFWSVDGVSGTHPTLQFALAELNRHVVIGIYEKKIADHDASLRQSHEGVTCREPPGKS